VPQQHVRCTKKVKNGECCELSCQGPHFGKFLPRKCFSDMVNCCSVWKMYWNCNDSRFWLYFKAGQDNTCGARSCGYASYDISLPLSSWHPCSVAVYMSHPLIANYHQLGTQPSERRECIGCPCPVLRFVVFLTQFYSMCILWGFLLFPPHSDSSLKPSWNMFECMFVSFFQFLIKLKQYHLIYVKHWVVFFTCAMQW